MRVAVIGCGSIGRRHVGNLLALGCEVFALDSDGGATHRAKREHPRLTIGIPRSFDGDIDAAVIATPWHNHLTWVEWAIRMQIPFFVEKPLGSLEQLPRWRELAALDLPINQVGYQCRFHPKAQALKDMAISVTPDYGTFYCDVNMRTWPGAYGPLLLEASHDLDLMLWLGAEPRVVHCIQRDGSIGLYLGSARWLLRLRDGRPYYRAWSMGVFGDGGGSLVEFTAPEALGDELYRAEMAHFLDCVRNQTPTLVPLADGLKVLEVCAQVETRCPSLV